MIDAGRFNCLDYMVMLLSVMVVALSTGCEDGVAEADAVSGCVGTFIHKTAP